MRPRGISQPAVVLAQTDMRATCAPEPLPCVPGRPVLVPLTDGGLETLDDLDRRLDAALDVVAGDPLPTLALDMSTVGCPSSSTIAALLWTRRRCAARGVRLVLRGMSRRCQSMLERAGMLGFFQVEPMTGRRGRASTPTRL